MSLLCRETRLLKFDRGSKASSQLSKELISKLQPDFFLCSHDPRLQYGSTLMARILKWENRALVAKDVITALGFSKIYFRMGKSISTALGRKCLMAS